MCNLTTLTKNEWLTLTLIHESCYDMDGERQEFVCKEFKKIYNEYKNKGKDVSYFDRFYERLR